ncbi:MAG: NUDIX hydrolase [Ruminococcaceae bacterium]|nr:NUDIX hydrolase [Oscillospiraceae bacterium]
MELRNKNGLTEQEFLATYNADKYPKPSLTADVVLFSRTRKRLRLLLIRRGGHPYLGCLALPGGFADKNEPLEQTAARELLEETGIDRADIKLVGLFSKPGRDPRGWVVTAAYMALVDAEKITVTAGDDAADARWYDVTLTDSDVLLNVDDKEISLRDGTGFAFDHAEIILRAADMLRHDEAGML